MCTCTKHLIYRCVFCRPKRVHVQNTSTVDVCSVRLSNKKCTCTCTKHFNYSWVFCRTRRVHMSSVDQNVYKTLQLHVQVCVQLTWSVHVQNTLTQDVCSVNVKCTRTTDVCSVNVKCTRTTDVCSVSVKCTRTTDVCSVNVKCTRTKHFNSRCVFWRPNIVQIHNLHKSRRVSFLVPLFKTMKYTNLDVWFVNMKVYMHCNSRGVLYWLLSAIVHIY